MLREKLEQLQGERELIRARSLCASSTVDLLVYGGAFSVLALVLFPLVNHVLLLVWFAANGGMVWYRYHKVRSFKMVAPVSRDKAPSFLAGYYSSFLLSGLFLGSAGFFLFPVASEGRQLVLAIVLWGTSAMSLDSTASSLGVAFLYSLCLVLPVTLTSLLGGSDYHLLLGVVGGVFLCVQLFFSAKLNKFFHENLDLQLDNLELTSELVREVSNRISVENIMQTFKSGDDA